MKVRRKFFVRMGLWRWHALARDICHLSRAQGRTRTRTQERIRLQWRGTRANACQRENLILYEFRQKPLGTPSGRDLTRLTEDQLDTWQERVAICVIDGGLTEAEAEAIAWRQVEAERSAAT